MNENEILNYVIKIVKQEWECLSIESEVGVPPRSSASVSVYLNKIYVIGGKTKTRSSAEMLWTFDLGTTKFMYYFFKKKIPLVKICIYSLFQFV
jgi:hypothetical protein